MPDAPSVGAKIRRARKLLRLTQQELAVKVGVSRNTVDAWENNRTYPKRYDVALEQVLGISLDEDEQAPGPLDDLKPWHEPWEEQVAADEGLAVETRRWLIEDSRVAREANAARKQSRMDRSLRDPGRAAG